MRRKRVVRAFVCRVPHPPPLYGRPISELYPPTQHGGFSMGWAQRASSTASAEAQNEFGGARTCGISAGFWGACGRACPRSRGRSLLAWLAVVDGIVVHVVRSTGRYTLREIRHFCRGLASHPRGRTRWEGIFGRLAVTSDGRWENSRFFHGLGEGCCARGRSSCVAWWSWKSLKNRLYAPAPHPGDGDAVGFKPSRSRTDALAGPPGEAGSEGGVPWATPVWTE